MRFISALVIAHLVCMSTAMDAQQLFVGPRLGGTSAVQHQSYAEYHRLGGITAGLDATLEVSSWIAFQAEASYVQKGAQNKGYYEMTLDYLEAPLLVRIGSPLGASSLRPFLTAGVAPGEEIRCSGYEGFPHVDVPLDAIDPTLPGTRPLDCDSERKRRTDFGSILGGGLSFNSRGLQFTAEMRRTRGKDISGYSCCSLSNDVTSFLVGVSRRVR
jgi:hypothetical protein